MKRDISIIIPVFNAEKYLSQCIESIISSAAFERTEILLVDDGSNDGSAEICDKYSDKYENIKSFHIENSGVSKARNVGLKNSSGEYITFCDADDYYLNDILLNVTKVIENCTPDFIFFDFFYENEEQSENLNYPFEKETVLNSNFIKNLAPEFMLKNSSFNSVWNKFFKKKLLNEIFFDTNQKHGEDRDFVLKYLLKCESAYYIPVEGYFYRYVKSGAVNKIRFDYFDNIQKEYEFRLKIYKKFDIDYDEVCYLCEKSVIEQIISCTLSSARTADFITFKKIMSCLYKNDSLLLVLSKDKSGKISAWILNKKTYKIYMFAKYCLFKEKVYKLL